MLPCTKVGKLGQGRVGVQERQSENATLKGLPNLMIANLFKNLIRLNLPGSFCCAVGGGGVYR